MILNAIGEMPPDVSKKRDHKVAYLSYYFNVDSPFTAEGEITNICQLQGSSV